MDMLDSIEMSLDARVVRPETGGVATTFPLSPKTAGRYNDRMAIVATSTPTEFENATWHSHSTFLETARNGCN
ncbi:MAG: hypothetical protein KatS3mg105_3007 [Gemmatales bacterium]|nr:MAG: hypothetical protein KatS3mg105_3007 [Gemmatales bacterium]